MKNPIIQFQKIKMNLFVATLLLISVKANSQIALENSYPNGKYKVSMIKLSNSGKKYQREDASIGEIKLYNLDHSLFKTMNFPLPVGNQSVHIYYTSENTFDLDNGVEYMVYYIDDQNMANTVTKIYNEDGTELFSRNGEGPTRYADNVVSIHNTINGAKMIFDEYINSDAKVYSLPGVLVATVVSEQRVQEKDLLLYPNPARNYIKMAYTLPANIKEADMIIYNSMGAVIKTYRIDNNFQEILVDTKELTSGVYFCSVSLKNTKISSTKFVIQ